MKKPLICSLVFIFVITCHAFSQRYLMQVKPAGGKDWGYANEKGELVIPAQYSKCYRFSPEGLAVVYNSKERQYYFINTKGESLPTEISDFKLKDGLGFDVAGFQNGLILVKHKNKWGYIDSKGKLAIEAIYDDANDFNGGYAAAKSGNDYFVLNAKGNAAKVEADDITDIKDFSEGLAPYRAKNKSFGFVGGDGKIAIPAQFESVGYFHNGLAWAKAPGGQLGYIDTKGQWVIKPQFSVGRNFDKESGLARVKSGDKWGYVNREGKMMYMDDAKSWGDFSEGLCDGEKDDKKGFYNAAGKWVIEPQFEGIRDFKNGYAAAKKNDKWGIIDKTGKWVVAPQFEGIKDLEKIQ